ncbi:MAG: hypothetical protein DDT42_01861 [candidate division WS2 bacterium]|uniref:Uncharacterized protein n=1 Tax=Psychracetigena formicireducens TaxID=2986056 RepID=A0A9E2BI59_PSYF1|nr:hypothetical protein [Candidatus Psychracetigena formicireducens]
MIAIKRTNPPKGAIPPQPTVTPEYFKSILSRDRFYPQEALNPQQRRISSYLEKARSYIDKPFNPFVNLVYRLYQKGYYKTEDLPPLVLPGTTYPSMAAAGATINLERKFEAAEMQKPPRKTTTTWLPEFLTALDFLGYGIRGGILEAGRPEATLPSVFEKFWKGVTLKEKPEGWDMVMEYAKRGHSWAKELSKNKWAMLGAGLALGIATNPMNFAVIKTRMLTSMAKMPDNLLEVAKMTGKARALTRGLSEADAVLEGITYANKASSAWKVTKPVEEVRKMVVDTMLFGKNIKLDLPFGAKYLKVYGKEIADVTPIFGAVKTAKDALVSIIPGATIIHDSIGNTFSLYYTSTKYMKDAVKLGRTKRALAHGIFAAPAIAGEAMTQTLIRMDDVTTQFPLEKWTKETLEQVTFSVEDPAFHRQAMANLQEYKTGLNKLIHTTGLDEVAKQADINSFKNMIQKTENEIRTYAGRAVALSPGQTVMAAELKDVLLQTRKQV